MNGDQQTDSLLIKLQIRHVPSCSNVDSDRGRGIASEKSLRHVEFVYTFSQWSHMRSATLLTLYFLYAISTIIFWHSFDYGMYLHHISPGNILYCTLVWFISIILYRHLSQVKFRWFWTYNSLNLKSKNSKSQLYMKEICLIDISKMLNTCKYWWLIRKFEIFRWSLMRSMVGNGLRSPYTNGYRITLRAISSSKELH